MTKNLNMKNVRNDLTCKRDNLSTAIVNIELQISFFLVLPLMVLFLRKILGQIRQESRKNARQFLWYRLCLVSEIFLGK